MARMSRSGDWLSAALQDVVQQTRDPRALVRFLFDLSTNGCLTGSAQPPARPGDEWVPLAFEVVTQVCAAGLPDGDAGPVFRVDDHRVTAVPAGGSACGTFLRCLTQRVTIQAWLTRSRFVPTRTPRALWQC